MTNIAEVILESVFNVAWYQMVSRYGRPTLDNSTREVEDAETGINASGFVIIAYGKMGGIELGYGSDLDLIFLHDPKYSGGSTSGPKSIENKIFYIRLAQRIIHILTTQTASGNLYEIDIRLRPNGSSGLLVSDLDAFYEYQKTKAWTWEHQALVRARPVTGDRLMADRFNQIRHDILCQKRNPSDLRMEVLEMRKKMVKHLSKPDSEKFAIKQDPGGIADIEFIVQYFVLRFTCLYPSLIQYTDNIRQIEALLNEGILKEVEAELLSHAYRAYRSMVHRLTLQGLEAEVEMTKFIIYRRRISHLWHNWLEKGLFDNDQPDS